MSVPTVAVKLVMCSAMTAQSVTETAVTLNGEVGVIVLPLVVVECKSEQGMIKKDLYTNLYSIS